MRHALEPATRSVPRPLPRLADDAHKGDAGRVLCVAGSVWMPGAAVLVARAAQRAGAGLVTLGCLDRAVARIVPTAAPEAVLLDLSEDLSREGSDTSPEGTLEEHLAGPSPDARLVGPGIGDDARARALVTRVLAMDTIAPLVLDADALNALDGQPEELRDTRAPLVITPHPGEAGRLLGAAVPRDEAGRVDAARRLARRSGAIVCLKGHGTVVLGPDEAAPWICRTGNAGMATAGAGDVLAGILVAYLAAHGGERWTALDAARAAVHVHGLAGDLAAARLGRRALVASDLIDALSEAQRRFEGEAT